MRDAGVARRWLAAAQWLLIAAAAYSGARAVNAGVRLWLDATDQSQTSAKPSTDQRRGGPTLRQTRDYAIILERNLFGSEPIHAAASSAPVPAASLTEDSLDLRLRGTAEVEGRGYAVIEDATGQRQDVFAVGDLIFNGPELVAVSPGRAVILLRGRRHTLEIAEFEHEREKTKRQSAKPSTASEGIRKTGEATYLVDRREVEHSIENLNSIVTQMRAVPYLKDGETLGFRVFNIRRGSLFERMGLENGDVIQRVNGVELNSPTKGLALLEDVQTTDEIRVDLLRGDRPSTLTYTVR